MGLQKHKPAAQVTSDDPRLLELFREHQKTILRLAALEALNFTRGRLLPHGGVGGVRQVSAAVDLRIFHEQQVDVEAERSRIERDRQKLELQMAQVQKQLENQAFRSRAPQEVVRAAEHRFAELAEHHRKVVESLERLRSTGV
jgi:valyl-tRNA synthetase